MKLKNEALQKLYDKLGFDDTLVFGISRQSQIDKAFIECDEELSDSITFAQIKDLQDRCDIFEKSNGTLLGANLDLATKKRQLEKDLANAKKQMGYFTTSRDNWKSRAKHAEEEVEDLKKKLVELQQDYHELYEKNGESNARLDCLRGEVKWYRNRYRDQYDKIRELKFRLNSMYDVKYGEYVRSRDTGYKNGQTDLWDMLQNVNDAKPFELATCFPDVTCMDDILSWDLEDFLDAYKSWQEKNEQERIDDMRGYLDWFCMGRACCKCPLRTDEFKCGRGIWFRDIADEDIQRYYKKVREYYHDDNK